MSLTVEEHELNDRLRGALLYARDVMAAYPCRVPSPRIHVGSAVVDYLKKLCEVADDRIPAPVARFFGYDLIPEPDWEPTRIVVRFEKEVP